jgi:putative sporulation protein YtaF
MNPFLFTILESILFVTALSTDALVASLAYGSNKIKIPFASVQVIAFICTGVLGISLLLGTFLKAFIPGSLLKAISFLILLLLGVTKLLDHIIRSIINKHTVISKQFEFRMFNLNFILSIYANPKEADFDHSKVLSPREALSLALALSLDSLAAGVGAALGNVNILAVLIFSLLLSMGSIKLGELIGYKISNKMPFPISWLGGVLLIILAFFRLK